MLKSERENCVKRSFSRQLSVGIIMFLNISHISWLTYQGRQLSMSQDWTRPPGAVFLIYIRRPNYSLSPLWYSPRGKFLWGIACPLEYFCSIYKCLLIRSPTLNPRSFWAITVIAHMTTSFFQSLRRIQNLPWLASHPHSCYIDQTTTVVPPFSKPTLTITIVSAFLTQTGGQTKARIIT